MRHIGSGRKEGIKIITDQTNMMNIMHKLIHQCENEEVYWLIDLVSNRVKH